ncbi:MAG: enoyl-CoA hydratase/isomerase family protein [Halorubrum sp.]
MIAYERRGEAAWITLDRPAKKNALHLDGWRDLREALERAESEASVAVVTGVEDVFSAGDDIAVIEGADTLADLDELVAALGDVLFGIETLDVPVIAAVNGLAYGGGCELVAAADLAVATPDATFALPEASIGAYPPYAAERVAETVGKKRFMELALTAQPIGAERAADWGLLNRVVSPADLESTVDELVAAIAATPAASIRTTKRVVAARAREAGERERVRGGFAQVRADEECRTATERFLGGGSEDSRSGGDPEV